VKILQIVGRKNSGKTGLVVRLIPLLQSRGLSVATVKHSSHSHDLDSPESDSGRHREAGAEATLVIAGSRGALHFSVPSSHEALVERYLGDHDLVLIEGWKSLSAPKIEVLPADEHGVLCAPRFGVEDGLIAIVLAPGLGGDASGFGVSAFGWDDVEGVGEFVEGWLGG
jgi:molybdopterin-guanine dinucleotide biosynthesis protein B